jgi:hypothetical protein
MPIPEHQDALEEEFFFNYLPSNFPKEFGELCLIPPLDKNKDLITTVQENLGEIVFRHRKRFMEDKDYFVRIEQCIRSAASVEKALREFVDLFMRMDTAHRDTTLYVGKEIAKEIAMARFPDKLDEFLGQLDAMAAMMTVLAAAVTVGTGISAAKRGRGRPQSPYTSPAFELMQQWESLTAEPMTEGEALIAFGATDDLATAERRAIRRINTPFDGLKINKVPTPRPLAKGKDKDQKRQFAEHSTAFIGKCLEMINPGITTSQVITSIKHAVKQRALMEKVLQNVKTGKNPFFARVEAVVAARN